MPTISRDDKTITWVCQADDEAKVRVGLKELLDKNPGYTPVLVVEGANGKETTYNTLTQSSRRTRVVAEEVVEEEVVDTGPDASTDEGE